MAYDYRDYNTLTFRRDDRILTVALSRPEQMNAVDARMHAELARVFSEINADPDTDVVVLTGAGRAFSAGGDLNWLEAMAADPAEFRRVTVEGKAIIFSLLDVEKPVIAKVNGACVGLGATLALFCDVIFASERAKLGDPHVLVGLVAGDGGAVIWPQLVGYARAKEYLFTGDQLDARRAAEIGLINHCVAADQLDATVDAFARRLAGGAIRAIQWTKVCVNIGLKQLAHSILDASLAYEGQSNATQDHREAVRAFLERRKPRFVGA
jgi:enoyl-CoA hydratase